MGGSRRKDKPEKGQGKGWENEGLDAEKWGPVVVLVQVNDHLGGGLHSPFKAL